MFSVRLQACAFALILLATACSKEADYITTIPPSENPYVLEADTFSGVSTVYRLDSFVTSSKPQLFAGRHSDAVFGAVNSDAYFKVTIPTSIPTLTAASYYDSLVLVLKPSKIHYGDTMSTYEPQLYRLAQNMANEYSGFYNNQSFATYPTPLGSKAVRYRPNVDDSIIIKLDNILGQELWQMLKTSGENITDATVFMDYLKGFCIKTAAGTNVMYGLPNVDSAISVQLHYHDDVGINENKKVVFPLQGSGYSFNAITANRTGTTLAELDTKKEIITNNYIYNQELTGVKTRVSFPYLKEILKTASFVKVLNAQYVIVPDNARYLSMYALPPALNLYYYTTTGALEGPQADANGAAVTGSLYIDQDAGLTTNYSYDVTAYVAAELAATDYTTTSPVLQTANADNAFYELVAGAPGNAQYKTRLVLNMVVNK